jgi:hypothetical protein
MEAGISVPRAPQLIGIPFALFLALVGFAIAIAVLGAGSNCGGNVAELSSSVPAELAPIYERAAARYELGPQGPSMLAGINKVETDFGNNTSTSSAGAQGWMQFLPSTWASFGVDGDGDGRKDIANPWDAIFGAAKYLRASGAPDDWHGAILAYNHAEWYVQEVVSYAERFVSGSAISTAGIGCAAAATGPAVLRTAIKVFQPRRYVMLPRRFMAPGYRPEPIDARLLLDAEWVLDTYGLRVTAAREMGHESHGAGTALDMVPVAGNSHQVWVQSAQRLAEDFGWTRSCGSSGLSSEFGGACHLVPAIRFIAYNGFPGHGEGDHIHVSWQDSLSPGATGTLVSPQPWVKVFPVAGAGV